MQRYIYLSLLAFILSACGGSVAIPQDKVIKPSKVENIRSVLKIYPKDSVEKQSLSKANLKFPKVGEKNS
ncbi:MAG: hypothetical protein JJW00_02880, partial [Sulfurimonas sp.]|nr:hypothetical protein [Sulfurimonas sp.]